MLEAIGGVMMIQGVPELDMMMLVGTCVSSLVVVTGEICISVLKRSEMSAAKSAPEVLSPGQSA